jgi:hypothetical protein
MNKIDEDYRIRYIMRKLKFEKIQPQCTVEVKRLTLSELHTASLMDVFSSKIIAEQLSLKDFEIFAKITVHTTHDTL